MTSFDSCGKSPGPVTIEGFSSWCQWMNFSQLILFWLIRSHGGPVHIPSVLVEKPVLLYGSTGPFLRTVPLLHSVLPTVTNGNVWGSAIKWGLDVLIHLTHETILGRERGNAQKKCASGGSQTYWNCSGSPQHSAGEINILDPDDLVTEEGTQGPDSK